jgi:hypothetical protein
MFPMDVISLFPSLEEYDTNELESWLYIAVLIGIRFNKILELLLSDVSNEIINKFPSLEIVVIVVTCVLHEIEE